MGSALYRPFLVVLMGYSGAGESYTTLAQDEVIAAIIGTLPSPVNVTVPKISETPPNGGFAVPQALHH